MVNANGKILKKKVLPKTKVVDEKGSEWEVIDKKKSVVGEVSASEDGRTSESDSG